MGASGNREGRMDSDSVIVRAMHFVSVAGLAVLALWVFGVAMSDNPNPKPYIGSVTLGIKAVWVFVVAPALFGFLIAQRGKNGN